jgi:hypothetical protein
MWQLPARHLPSAQLTATPAAGPSFAGWTGGIGSCTVMINAAQNVIVPFDRANSRIFVEFGHANEVVHGSTSVAVETQ